jgi:hypothetical protein
MPPNVFPAELERQRREELARRYTENAEAWLRRIVHHQLSEAYGRDFLRQGGLVKNAIREYVVSQREANPGKFLRDVDATTFDQLIDIATNPSLFKAHFERPLEQAYPVGRDEARNFLTKLRDIRNDVSHGRGCSARCLEQAICYSNDLIDALKKYFKETGMQRTYDVPSIIRFSDNRGNTSHLENVPENVNSRFIDWRRRKHGDLHPGDTLVAEIEVDSSFPESEYDITWDVFAHENGSGPIARVQIQNKHVGEQFELRFRVVSKRDWHRFVGCDDGLGVLYRVLPPVT